MRSHFLKLLLHFCFSKLALKLAHFKAPFVCKKNIFWEIQGVLKKKSTINKDNDNNNDNDNDNNNNDYKD